MTIRQAIKRLEEHKRLVTVYNCFYDGFDCVANNVFEDLRALESHILRILTGEKKHSRLAQLLLSILGTKGEPMNPDPINRPCPKPKTISLGESLPSCRHLQPDTITITGPDGAWSVYRLLKK